MSTLNSVLNPFYKDKPGVEPWDYNPSAWGQRVPICLLAMVGFLIATYLALYQWGLVASVWDPFFSGKGGQNGTETVITSDTSHTMTRWFRIPDASLGALAYLGDAIFGFAGSTRRWQYRPWLVVIFGIDVIPLGVVSAILVVLQGVQVGYWCTLCLVTAVISLILVRMAVDEVWTCLLYQWRVFRRSKSWKLLWLTFWGYQSDMAAEVAAEMVKKR